MKRLFDYDGKKMKGVSNYKVTRQKQYKTFGVKSECESESEEKRSGSDMGFLTPLFFLLATG